MPRRAVLVRRTPLTESPSSIWTCRSASRRWRSAVTAWRIRATWRVSRTAGGSTISESSARRQLRATIATAVPTTTVTLAAIEVAVLVTTPCMLPMSLTRRDWTSPPRVRVKKPSDWRCRWANRSLRRRCMTRWPTEVESQVCTTPIAAVATATPSIAPTHEQQQAHVLLGERLVDDVAHQEGLGQADDRAARRSGRRRWTGCRGAVRRGARCARGRRGVRELPPVGGVGTAAAGAAGTGVVIHATSSSLGDSNSREVTSL